MIQVIVGRQALNELEQLLRSHTEAHPGTAATSEPEANLEPESEPAQPNQEFEQTCEDPWAEPSTSPLPVALPGQAVASETAVVVLKPSKHSTVAGDARLMAMFTGPDRFERANQLAELCGGITVECPWNDHPLLNSFKLTRWTVRVSFNPSNDAWQVNEPIEQTVLSNVPVTETEPTVKKVQAGPGAVVYGVSSVASREAVLTKASRLAGALNAQHRVAKVAATTMAQMSQAIESIINGKAA